MDKEESDLQIIQIKEMELNKFEKDLSFKMHEIESYKDTIANLDLSRSDTDILDIKRKIETHKSDCENLNKKIEEIKRQISILKQKLEK